MKHYNFFAILVSAVASFALQFVWFTVLFAEPYLAGLGKTQAEMDQGATGIEAMSLQLVGNLILAFVMAWLILKLNYQTASQGLQLSMLIWLGFVVCVVGPMFAFQAYSISFFMINAFGYLIPIAVSGIILTLWKR